MMAGATGGRTGGALSVPPGFRFHPTDEELLDYYLRKKIAYEAIDLDVIREVDLNRLEPWDLKEKCRIGSGPQDEWYFFSHKDKKYPTGTRTNRATTAGFWKATGRDKAIHLASSGGGGGGGSGGGGGARRIGMRKTLVFYIGRAPNGQKTDWIMHEYRLDDEHQRGYHNATAFQEEGWVVCRVFKKKNHQRPGMQYSEAADLDQQQHLIDPKSSTSAGQLDLAVTSHHQTPWSTDHFSMEPSMHLPQLLSAESASAGSFMPAPGGPSMTPLDVVECSHNLLKLTSTGHAHSDTARFMGGGDWTLLDRLLGSNHPQLDQLFQGHGRVAGATLHLQDGLPLFNHGSGSATSAALRFPLQYLGCDGAELLKMPK